MYTWRNTTVSNYRYAKYMILITTVRTKHTTYNCAKNLFCDSMAGIARPKNVFSWTLKLSIKLQWKFLILQIFLLTEWLAISLNDYLMPSDKRNLIIAKAIGLISSLFNIASFRDMATTAASMLTTWFYKSQPLFSFVLICSAFLSQLLHSWRFAVASHCGFMEDLVTAVIAEVFNMLSFCLKAL